MLAASSQAGRRPRPPGPNPTRPEPRPEPRFKGIARHRPTRDNALQRILVSRFFPDSEKNPKKSPD